MKSVLTSIQPYYVFLIIARAMGWKVEQEKTVEVRKNFPKAPDWDKKVIIYCSKNKRSFKRIPKEYQPFMAPLLGKAIGEFVCDEVYRIEHSAYYSWHISDLKIYDKPKELSELTTPFCPYEVAKCKVGARLCKHYTFKDALGGECDYGKRITRPPQSWCYVEAI